MSEKKVKPDVPLDIKNLQDLKMGIGHLDPGREGIVADGVSPSSVEAQVIPQAPSLISDTPIPTQQPTITPDSVLDPLVQEALPSQEQDSQEQAKEIQAAINIQKIIRAKLAKKRVASMRRAKEQNEQPIQVLSEKVPLQDPGAIIEEVLPIQVVETPGETNSLGVSPVTELEREQKDAGLNITMAKTSYGVHDTREQLSPLLTIVAKIDVAARPKIPVLSSDTNQGLLDKYLNSNTLNVDDNVKSVLDYTPPSKDNAVGGLTLNQERLFEQLAQEYPPNADGTPIIFANPGTSDAPPLDGDPTERVVKNLSFSDDGRTVTLPNDDTVSDTVAYLNVIAKSNIMHQNNQIPMASVKIEQVTEKDLLDILQKFNENLVDDVSFQAAHLQLSYKNPNSASPNEAKIQEIMQQHNELHSTLQAGQTDPDMVIRKRAELTQSISQLKTMINEPNLSGQSTTPIRPTSPVDGRRRPNSN